MNKVMDNYGLFDYIETPEGTYEYTAEEMRRYFAGVIGNGVLKDYGDQFEASAAGLAVTIGTGEAWLLGANGELVNVWTADLDPVTEGMSRICSIVLELDIANQLIGISVLVGTQAESPSAPVLTQSEAIYQQLLYQARVYDDGSVVMSDYRNYISRPGDGVDPTAIGAVSFKDEQALNDTDKGRARNNINASSKPLDIAITLTAAGWTSGLYTISNAAITATNAVLFTPSAGVTAAQLEALQAANVQRYSQATGQVVIKAYGDVPTIDLPVAMTIWG